MISKNEIKSIKKAIKIIKKKIKKITIYTVAALYITNGIASPDNNSHKSDSSKITIIINIVK